MSQEDRGVTSWLTLVLRKINSHETLRVKKKIPTIKCSRDVCVLVSITLQSVCQALLWRADLYFLKKCKSAIIEKSGMSKNNMHRIQNWGRPTGYCQSMWQRKQRHLRWAQEPMPWCPGSAEAKAATKDSDMCVGELCRDEVGRGRGEGGHLITASYASAQGPAHNNLGLRANHWSAAHASLLQQDTCALRVWEMGGPPGSHWPNSLARLVTSRFREETLYGKKKKSKVEHDGGSHPTMTSGLHMHGHTYLCTCICLHRETHI